VHGGRGVNVANSCFKRQRFSILYLFFPCVKLFIIIILVAFIAMRKLHHDHDQTLSAARRVSTSREEMKQIKRGRLSSFAIHQGQNSQRNT